MLQISAGRTARNTGILPPVWYAHILERNNRDAGEAAAEIASIIGNLRRGATGRLDTARQYIAQELSVPLSTLSGSEATDEDLDLYYTVCFTPMTRATPGQQWLVFL